MKIKELLIIAAVVFLVLGSILIGCEEPKATPPEEPAVDEMLGLLVVDNGGSAFNVGTIGTFEIKIYDTDNISIGNLFTGAPKIIAYGTNKKLTQDKTNVILYKGSSGKTQWSKTNGHGTYSVVMTGEDDDGFVGIWAKNDIVFDKGVGSISIDYIINVVPIYSNMVGLKLTGYNGSDPILVTDVISSDWKAGSIAALLTSGNTNGAYIYSASEKNLKNASWDKNDHILLLSGTGGTNADIFDGTGGSYTVFAVKGVGGSDSNYITDVTFTGGSASADFGTAGTVGVP